MPNRIFEHGLYYKLEGDSRMHFDSVQANILLASIPNLAHDKCPKCGSTKLNQCRCPENHRFCSDCKTQWRWILDNATATISQVIE
jgi:hypothetical protein